MVLNQKPETVGDYEKLLISSPDSSFVWIQYISYQLALGDLEKARAVVERALKTINFKLSAELTNIWVSYLNLENSYGTQETLTKIFNRSINSVSSPKNIHLIMAEIYERTNKIAEADQLFQIMTKKIFNFNKNMEKICQFFNQTKRRNQI